jgi:hypothetical protein
LCWRAVAMASRMSLTPLSTAESCRKCASAWRAAIRARVVLPTPGGPQNTMECSCPLSIAWRSGLPAASRWACPVYSARQPGRSRAASGW